MASVVPMTLGACGGGDSGTSTFGATIMYSFDSASADTLTFKFTSPSGLTTSVLVSIMTSGVGTACAL